MKAITTLLFTAAIVGGAVSAQASPGAERGLELCKAEIHGMYGEHTELALIDTRHGMNGISIRVAARLDDDNSNFVTCWIPRSDSGTGYNSDSTQLVSASVEPVAQ